MEDDRISEEELRKLQLILLDMAKVVKKICEEENIKYYILGGTLLGAVRHKGFIPWDDDFDFVMPREDYNRFLKIVQEKLPENLDLFHYSVEKYKDDKIFAHFAKIINLKYSMYTRKSDEDYKRSVFIDIIPLDGMPKNGVVSTIFKIRVFVKLQKLRIARVNNRKNSPGGYKGKNLLKRVVYTIVSNLFSVSNEGYLKILKEYDQLLSKYCYEEAKYVSNILGGHGLFKETFFKSDFGEGKLYPFEDTEFIGGTNYDRILSHMYGKNYNELPPEKERVCKHCVRLEVND